MSNEDILVNNYAAAFIDLLGQREELKGCGLLPANKEEFLKIAKKSIGAINSLHSQFDIFCNAFSDRTDESAVPQEVMQIHNNFQPPQIKFQRFSDGLFVFTSLTPNPDHSPINGVYTLLAVCGSLCLNFLAGQQPLRAGIDIAWGAELNDNELYGCVVAKSYELESEAAQYPRIVIGDEVVRYLHLSLEDNAQNLNSKYARAMAGVCLEIITQDHDGHFIVDYLGSEFKKYIANNIDSAVYTEAYEFIGQQLDYWRSKGDNKLVSRYEALKSYFDRNREIRDS